MEIITLNAHPLFLGIGLFILSIACVALFIHELYILAEKELNFVIFLLRMSIIQFFFVTLITLFGRLSFHCLFKT